jgi:hypothetical protein
MEHSMSKEKRFDIGRGLQGCLVSGMCWLAMLWFVACCLLPLLERSELFAEIFNKAAPVLLVVGWLFAICLGGYYAARQGKTTGWTNSLVVGLLAECYLVVPRLVETSFPKMLVKPIPDSEQLKFLALTIPAALVGGIVSEKTCGLKEAGGGNERSEPVSDAGPQEE